jgi:ankyrin repeat protein
VIALLIERGAQIDAVDNRGRTALMIAAENGYPAVVEALIRGGADRTRRDNDGKSAFDLAANDSVRERLTERQSLSGEIDSTYRPAR